MGCVLCNDCYKQKEEGNVPIKARNKIEKSNIYFL